MLVFLQMDAAGDQVLQRLLAEGRMPVLEELRSRGTWLSLENSTDLMFEAAVYPTLYTGVEIADHGFYYPLVWDPEAMRVRYMDRFPKPSTVWERLAGAGARSLVIDPYQLWETPAEGACFSSWQYQHKIIPRWGSPRSVNRRAVRRFGRPPILVDVAGRRTVPEVLAMRRVLLDAPARVERLAVDLLERERFDFAWIVFTAMHQAGHHLWELPPLKSPPSPEERRLLETGLEEVYERCDAALGRIIEALPAGAELVVFSPIGMGPQTMRSDLLPEMVERILGGDGGGSAAGSSIWSLRAQLPSSLRRGVNRALPGWAVRETVARAYTRGIDWSKTRATVLPGDHFGYIRLNVRGRESDGIVDPDQAGPLMDEIEEGLLSFEDDDGAPSVATVRRPQLELTGERTGQLPDLVAEWSDHPSTGLTGVRSPRLGRIPRRGVGSGRSGNHQRGAWVLVAGGDGDRGATDPPPNVVDLAATVCAWAGLGEEMTGQPLADWHR